MKQTKIEGSFQRIITLIISALLGSFLGTVSGIAFACTFQFGGNLCGLVGIIYGGPIGAVIGFISGVVYVIVRDKKIKREDEELDE